MEAPEIDPVVGLGGGFALRPRPQTHTVERKLAIELEGGVAVGRAAVKSLFTSALEYHARVPGQRDAALEPLDAGYASRGTIRPTPTVQGRSGN